MAAARTLHTFKEELIAAPAARLLFIVVCVQLVEDGLLYTSDGDIAHILWTSLTFIGESPLGLFSTALAGNPCRITCRTRTT